MSSLTKRTSKSSLTKRTTKADRPAHHANSTATSFQNPWPSAGAPTWAELTKVSFPLSWYKHKTLPGHVSPVEVVTPDWGASRLAQRPEASGSRCLVATWLGHAGAMVEVRGGKESTYLVFDPIFSPRAGPTQYTGPGRLRKSPCQVSDFPGCHAVFISHNHYDHLDLATVQEITKKFPATKWFVPLANKKWFLASGLKNENIIELDWWQSWEGRFFEQQAMADGKENPSFKISCVPSQHNSGRRGTDGGSTLWCGWAVEQFSMDDKDGSKSRRISSIYHAGDTGYRRIEHSKDSCPAFKEIGNKFGGFDLSFIPIWRGGSLGFVSYAGLRLLHRHIPSAFHCSPADAVEIHKDVKSKNTIAVHFATFVGSEEESNEALLEFHEACKEASLGDLEGGEAGETGRAGALNIGGSLVISID